jgi:hypothetical protein
MTFRKTIPLVAMAIMWLGGAGAQSFEWELRLDTKFDNHERSKLALPTAVSGTFFSARLAPVVGIGWETQNTNGTRGKHSVMAGGSVTLDFSSRPSYSRHLEPQLYYNFHSPRWGLYAGMFERRHLIGIYSRATYSGIASFYDNIVQGLAMQYHTPGGHAEVVLDWDGAQSSTRRESFRVLLAGDWNRSQLTHFRWLELGASVDWYHLASRAGGLDGVFEHILTDVWLGARLEQVWPWFQRLSLGAGWLQSMDRDRASGLDSWLSPGGLTIDAAVQKWRVGIRNRYYHGLVGPGGGTQMPLWSTIAGNSALADNGVGPNRIYKGDPMYASARRYNYTSIYWRPTIGNGVEVNLELGLHSDLRRIGFQQVVWVGVTLDNDFFRKK